MTDLLDRLKQALADRYDIERELGRGGMAVVFLAQDTKLGRPVALKVLRPELAAVLGAERFVREIEIAAQLTHPNILPLHDCGEADGQLYYTMPFVEGESLREKLQRENQLAIGEALDITAKVARALDHAHQRGVIHRDIKPENILLHDGEPMVADFGIALAVTEAGGSRLTETGLSLGTPSYMSPEQATGDRTLDARTDVYSLASVLYEMLAGDPPFAGSNVRAVIAKVIGEKPTSIGTLRDTVPPHIEIALEKALAKAPADRFASAGAFATAVCAAPDAAERSLGVSAAPSEVTKAPGDTRSRRVRRVAAAAIVLLVAVAAAWLYRHNAHVRWARNVAIPEIVRLQDQNDSYDAFHLALAAERYIPDDAQLQRLKHRSALSISVRTTPDGADVYYADYLDTTATNWMYLGRTPMDDVLVPATINHLRWRVEKAGFEPALGTFIPWVVDTLRRTLQPVGDGPVGMVRVPGGRDRLSGSDPVELAPYWLDRYEVTNEAFQEFVDAGGYQKREHWEDALAAEGRDRSWQEVVAQFTDRTGRPGPATWEVGSFADGEANYPVRGVSWYEAAAYCRFAGKDLPTVYHWRRAAQFSLSSDILLLSNFGGVGPVAVDALRGLGPYGTYGMAGNVKEWVWNARGTDRYILGGAWNEPDYMFHDMDGRPPAQRSPSFGFRCARYDQPLAAGLIAPVAEVRGDFAHVQPVSDEAFRIFTDLYAYDPTPLNVVTESTDENAAHWREEVVTFDAAYGNERVIAHLYLPRTGSPPYQTVVYFPASSALSLPSSENLVEANLMAFIPRTGRALLYPVYQGTYERRPTTAPGPNALRDRTIQWGKDLRRSIDYLETRDDIDHERLAFIGLSMGAVYGPIFTAIEDRFAASVLLLGGLNVRNARPEVDPINFAPRSTLPTLMVNGRNDFDLPLETSQLPLFRLLGTPERDKRHAVLEGGHMPFDFSNVIRETLDWLDRYLGPVN